MVTRRKKVLILSHTIKDDLRDNLVKRLDRYGIKSILHDESSLDKAPLRVISEIKLIEFIVTPATLYPHPSFEYEWAIGQSKRKPIPFISSINGLHGLPDVFARQVFDITFSRVQALEPLMSPGLRLFLNDLLADNIHIQMLDGLALVSLGSEVNDERVRGM